MDEVEVQDLSGEVEVLSYRAVFIGPYSSVYRGKLKRHNHLVAIKVINPFHGAALHTIRRKIDRERKTWSVLDHPNILPLYGFADDDDLFQPLGAFISPWLQRGDLSQFLAEYGTSSSLNERLELWIGIIAGATYLHNYNPILIHGDLKPRNILIDDGGNPRICDFGLVRIYQEEGNSGMTTTTAHTGTERYLAYELVLAEDAIPTTASDIYAIGCIGLEESPSFTGATPISYVTVCKTREQPSLVHFKRHAIRIASSLPPIDLSPNDFALWDIISACWARDPLSRPHVGDLFVALRNARPPPPPAAQIPPSQLGLSFPSGAQGHLGNGGSTPYTELTGPGGYQGELYDRDRDGEKYRRDRERYMEGSEVFEEERPYPIPIQPRPLSQEIIPQSGLPVFPGSLSPHSLPPNLRKEGPDWFVLHNPQIPKKTLDVDLVHQFNHESAVCCVRFSKDGRFLATGCNRTAQIFDMETGNMVCQLSDNKATMGGDLHIRSVRFSPDGKFLVTGGEDRLIRVWDIAKKGIRNLFEGHEGGVYSLDFSPSGHLIVSGSGDDTTRIWNLETGTCTVLSVTEIAPVLNPSASGDRDTAMSLATSEGGIGPDAGVTSVSISPDGRLLAVGSLDAVVRLWDMQSGSLLERLRGHRDSVYSVAFTPDGRGLVSGSLDKTLIYWELNGNALAALADGRPKTGPNADKYATYKFDFVRHSDYVLGVAISHNGQWVVSGSKDRGVRFWDRNGTVQLMLKGHKNSVISVDLSPTGGYLATGSGDWQARVWRYKRI